MNRVILVAFALMLTAPLALTQDTQGDADSIGGNFSLRTFRGCLSGAGNQYELTVGGAVPHKYRLLGSNLTQLDGKAGHLVSITGTMQESQQASAMTTNANSGQSDTINFLSLDDVASTCSASNGMGPAAETSSYPTDATFSAQQPWEPPTPSAIVIPTPELQAQRGSYILVPLVGVLALGFLGTAGRRRK